MKWKSLIIFGSLLSVFVPAFLSSPSYAINDVSVRIDAQNQNRIGICHSTNPSSSLTGQKCSDYKYIIFSSDVDYSTVSSGSYITFYSYNRLQFNTLSSPSVFLISSSEVSLSVFSVNVSNLSSGWYFDVTLSNDLPVSDCPVCPEPEEPEPCPEIPENPYDDKLDKIIQAIYVVAGTLLVIYFFYCIYRMIIKPLGGN